MPISIDKPFQMTRILLVEENPVFQLMIRSMSQILGAECVCITHADTVMAAFREGYDFVLLGLNLSYSAFELAWKMRANEPVGRHTPIIGHETVANPEEVENLCLSVGMDDLSPKVTSVKELHELTTRWSIHPLVRPVHLVDIHIPAGLM